MATSTSLSFRSKLQEEIQETHFGDSSGPVFCMDSKIAGQDDNTMAERSYSLLFTSISAFPASCVALLTCLVHSTFADRFKFKIWSVFDWLFEDVRNPVEDISLKRASEIDARISESTLNSLNEGDATEKFFAAIPNLFSSRWVNLSSTNLSAGLQDVFKESLYEFLDCTFQSTKVAESVKFLGSLSAWMPPVRHLVPMDLPESLVASSTGTGLCYYSLLNWDIL
jgi:hypothetical protein